MRLAVAAAVAATAVAASAAQAGVRTLTFTYHSSAGVPATAYLVLPSWYGPARHPALPFVISPHGRGVSGKYNLRFWGAIADRGPFVVVSPDGHGRKLPFYSWGWRGQIGDLARMPQFARTAFPWLRIAANRIYAIGDSMGAQEVLLLAARRDIRLAGVAAFDPVSDMAARYHAWSVTPGEQQLPPLARIELGGTPVTAPAAYAARSPIDDAGAIARSRVPIQLWWSRRDAVITDQAVQSERFYERLVSLGARVRRVVGDWEHGHAMHPQTHLPAALACFGLIPEQGVRVPFAGSFCSSSR